MNKSQDQIVGPTSGPTSKNPSSMPGVEGHRSAKPENASEADTAGRLATDAFFALLEGNLVPLATYLRSSPERIDPMVAKQLAKMIDGSKSESGYRLEVAKHPNLPSAKRGKEADLLNDTIKLKVAKFMVRRGALEKGGFEAAVVAAQAEFGKGATTIKGYWRAWKPAMQRRERALVTLRNKAGQNCHPNFEPQSD